ncbi:hypothetical protein K1T73_12020 [Roseovarius sp. SCSIO 43702]|uniref:hypothetical protein n=1 Tax=Roseovarius sp. SCSIO 43702 TaxID=2823043 RepID=UPI001C736E2D|nr:hypothetical protein [Roseovarius sp. SCSIO 43702]QYX55804.1 hypothetical protein K1T73_12020 [Roseovarius sp. SCSIO 43702]
MPVTRVAVSGDLFDVRVQGRRAEAVRLNSRWAPDRMSVAVAATHAIERVSGCRVAGLSGDQAMLEARLDCGAGAPPPKPRAAYLDCDFVVDGDGFGEALCTAAPR